MSRQRIQVQAVWKRYGLPLAAHWREMTDRLRGSSNPGQHLPWALQGISFETSGGETLGVIGRNGSGKSTLLKVIAGVTPASRGLVQTHGAIFPMIELNAGIHGDLSGRENIHILGAIMGLSPGHVRQLLPKIEEFCELGPWFDRPVRTYSSGMLVRLGFAVGIHVHADILLMDEVMAVGDINFHNKCMHQLDRLRSQGAAVMFVSHNITRIRLMCDRVLLLDQGRQLFLGPMEEGVRMYESLQADQAQQRGECSRSFDKEVNKQNFSTDEISLGEIEIRSPGGGPPLKSVPQGGDAEIFFTVESPTDIADAVINVALESLDGVSMVWNALEVPLLPTGRSGFVVQWRQLRLKSGVYPVRVGITSGQFLAKLMRSTGRVQLRMEGEPPSTLGLHTPQASFTMVGTTPLQDGT